MEAHSGGVVTFFYTLRNIPPVVVLERRRELSNPSALVGKITTGDWKRSSAPTTVQTVNGGMTPVQGFGPLGHVKVPRLF